MRTAGGELPRHQQTETARGTGNQGAPAGDLSDAVLDFFLSPQAQTILAEKAFVAPTNKETPKPSGFPDPAALFAPDWEFVAKNRAAWVDRWSKEMT